MFVIYNSDINRVPIKVWSEKGYMEEECIKQIENAALEKFSTEDVLKDLDRLGVILGKNNKNDVAEECSRAYKDIDFVISQELDLIKPIKKLKTIGVVKG